MVTTSTPTAPPTDLLADLRAALPADCVVSDPDVVETYRRDQAAWAEAGLPAAVVRARTPEQVRDTVLACLRHGAPVVARGAGTGLSGGANALEGGVVLSLERMDAVLAVDELESYAVVQPGVVNDDLRAAAAEHGLWYPPDPASSPWSTVGGNVATNAGGLCCVKYGVTRDYVLALQVVTGTGELIRVGHGTAKGVAGYDLVGLLVGSEGTLGIVTEVTVRLRPLPPPAHTVVGNFDSVVDAGEAVRLAGAAGLTPSAFELVDRFCLQAVDDWKHTGLASDAEVVLLARVDDVGAAGEQLADAMQQVFTDAGATWAARSEDADEAEALFAARRLAYPAVERLGPVMTEDVCVPKAQLPEMLARVQRAGQDHGITVATIAHAGDGNLHPLLITPDDEDGRRRAHAAFEQIITDALELGGTVTGEHGIGLLKRDGLRQELSPAVLAMHRAVKAALDPAGILNPGKVVAAEDVR